MNSQLNCSPNDFKKKKSLKGYGINTRQRRFAKNRKLTIPSLGKKMEVTFSNDIECISPIKKDKKFLFPVDENRSLSKNMTFDTKEPTGLEGNPEKNLLDKDTDTFNGEILPVPKPKRTSPKIWQFLVDQVKLENPNIVMSSDKFLLELAKTYLHYIRMCMQLKQSKIFKTICLKYKAKKNNHISREEAMYNVFYDCKNLFKKYMY